MAAWVAWSWCAQWSAADHLLRCLAVGAGSGTVSYFILIVGWELMVFVELLIINLSWRCGSPLVLASFLLLECFIIINFGLGAEELICRTLRAYVRVLRIWIIDKYWLPYRLLQGLSTTTSIRTRYLGLFLAGLRILQRSLYVVNLILQELLQPGFAGFVIYDMHEHFLQLPVRIFTEVFCYRWVYHRTNALLVVPYLSLRVCHTTCCRFWRFLGVFEEVFNDLDFLLLLPFYRQFASFRDIFRQEYIWTSRKYNRTNAVLSDLLFAILHQLFVLAISRNYFQSTL